MLIRIQTIVYRSPNLGNGQNALFPVILTQIASNSICNLKIVSVGGTQTCIAAVDSDGNVHTCGYNNTFCLGGGDSVAGGYLRTLLK